MSAGPPGGRVAVLGAALALAGAWHAVLILVLLAAALRPGEIAQAAARALSAALGAARERVQRRELEAALARQGHVLPVPCAHEHLTDVPDLTGTLVARLCPQCEAPLSPDFEALKGNR